MFGISYVSKLVALSLLLAFSLPSRAEELAQLSLKLGYVDFRPLMLEEDGKAAGAVIEMVRYIAADQNISVDFSFMPISRMHKEVAVGTTHAFIGLPTAPSVRNHILFRKADPVYELDLRVWALQGAAIPDFATRQPERLILLHGFNYWGLEERFAARRQPVIKATSHERLYKMLLAGRAPYALSYTAPMTAAVGAQNMALLTSRRVGLMPVYFNVSKKVPHAEQLLDAFHRGLVNFRAHQKRGGAIS